MAGGKNKIHEHPNAGTSTLRERPEDINRKGKTPGTHDFATLIQKALKERGEKELARYRMAQEWVRIAIDPTVKDNEKIKALKEITDRLEGPITQKIETTGINPVIQITPDAKEDHDKMKDM